MGIIENREVEIDPKTGEVTIDYTPSPILTHLGYTELPEKSKML